MSKKFWLDIHKACHWCVVLPLPKGVHKTLRELAMYAVDQIFKK